MKRLFALLVVLVMSLSLVACTGGENAANDGSSNESPVVETNGLTSAKNYLYTMYKDANEATPADFVRVGAVRIDGVSYEVKWSADSDTINFVYGDDKMVTVDVDEKNPEEVRYTLTATLTDANGNSESVSFSHYVPAAIIIGESMSYEEIVEAAYGLAEDTALDGTFRLYGTIVSIDTAWSEDYQNITVTIQVGDMADKPIMCYRLKGEGAKDLAIGDDITVEGTFKNYKGTIEFDAGCILIGRGEHADQSAILDAGYSLAEGLAMQEPCTLTGVISNIDTAWSEDYQNITVTIICDGKTEQPIMCYRLKGEGAKELAVGDTITVTGTLKNYKGTIEFDAGCNLDAVVKGEPVETPELNIDMTDAAAVLDAAYALQPGASLNATATLKGVITKIDTAWSDQYQNITVTIVVDGKTEQPIMCFRLKGNGAQELAVGDTITVTGMLKNYSGTIEFDAGCTLDAVVKGSGSAAGTTEPEDTKEPEVTIDMNDPAAVLDAAYALKDGASLNAPATLKGVITKVDTAWSDEYQNITVTIVVDGKTDKPIKCYRLKGEGAKDLIEGDTITVTGTLKNYQGTIEFDAGCTLDKVEKTGKPAEEPQVDTTSGAAAILDAAYALKDGQAMNSNVTLTGIISEIDTPWSDQYSNISVVIVVDGDSARPILCYRLKGEGAKELIVGDTVTVTGKIKNYKGIIEFDAGCNLDKVEKTGVPTEAPEVDVNSVESILKAAYELKNGESLGEEVTLTGVIKKVDTKWSDQYKNITVTIEIEGFADMPIMCYRLKGDGAKDLKVGDTITVTGMIKNYKGTIEFDAGCTLVSVTKA